MAVSWSLEVHETQPPALVAERTVIPVAGDTVVGRSREARLVLDDPRISRRHARLTVREDGLWVEPLGAGATYVGGTPLAAARRLVDGDWLQLGPVLFRVHARGTNTLLLVDTDTERAWLGPRLLALRPAEYRLLEALARAPGRWLVPEDLAQAIWADDPRQANVSYVNKYVSYVRRAIREALTGDGALIGAVREAVRTAAEADPTAPEEPLEALGQGER